MTHTEIDTSLAAVLAAERKAARKGAAAEIQCLEQLLAPVPLIEASTETL